ncbi:MULTISPECIES: hypothetical protein [Ehrlichia]|uniref:Uncharacterized protein n=1 Tax=Ehrlichia cf. muris str. EmCRT TaxID=1359167 RepID=A0A0F3NC68_9RICK|nr:MULTISPECIES: hypothetical protein [Ehrlichia]KJV65341.1 hypothetical protein EMUCRT_0279 [Ehrlichia cf. muris str. EmCRT]OUC04870.1 hypothetical protein DB91_00660 [Ehrlichia sp. Wisconsin_h]
MISLVEPYYGVNPNFDSKIGLPSSENAIFMPIHQTMFQKCCIVSNIRFKSECYFLFGKNKERRKFYLAIQVKLNFLRDLKANGLVFTKEIVFISGEIYLDSIAGERIYYLPGVFFWQKSASYIYVEFFNDSGELFHAQYQGTYLNHVIIDALNNYINV